MKFINDFTYGFNFVNNWLDTLLRFKFHKIAISDTLFSNVTRNVWL